MQKTDPKNMQKHMHNTDTNPEVYQTEYKCHAIVHLTTTL